MEIWKDISGYEGIYQVSNLGVVKSLDRLANSRWGFRPIEGKTLKAVRNGTGYTQVNLCNDGKCKIKSIHRLVAKEFLPDFTIDLVVNHINHDKTDNSLSNLEMLTQSENLKLARVYRLINGL